MMIMMMMMMMIMIRMMMLMMMMMMMIRMIRMMMMMMMMMMMISSNAYSGNESTAARALPPVIHHPPRYCSPTGAHLRAPEVGRRTSFWLAADLVAGSVGAGMRGGGIWNFRALISRILNLQGWSGAPGSRGSLPET